MELALLVVFTALCLMGMAWHEGAGRAQRRADAQAAREDRREARAQFMALERTRLLGAVPYGALGLLSGDARVNLTITGPREGAAPPAPAPETPAPVLPLPGLVTLDQLLRTGWRPDPDHVLLGLGPGGVRYEVPADDKLCHVLTVGRTGYGKSSFNRLLLPQLIACGFEVYLLDLDYAPVDPRNGEEWWPIAERTTPGDALYAVADIRAAIKEARAEVDRRHTIRRTVRGVAADLWPRRFYAIEEAPELVSQYPEFMDDAAHVLRRGRRVDVYLLLISQSGLIKVIGGNSDDRAMFGTIAYVGGVPTSARALLQETVPEPEGKGLARLRCYGVRTSADARLPYGDNAGIRALLATNSATTAATNGYGPGYTMATDNVIDLQARVAKSTPGVADVAISADARRALELFLAGKSMAEIVWELRGIKSSEGGKYQAALTECTDLVRQAMKAKGA
jgi:hypothetical protein